jgi:N-succinyldiaminopimelate aminotransferase
MNLGLKKLHRYPFEKMAEMKKGIIPPSGRELINLSIGEPKLRTPKIILESLAKQLVTTGQYPTTRGMPELRNTISQWASRRFKLDPGQLDPATQILPVNGTREALFSIANTIIDKTSDKNLVGLPNPFYQIYEGAALLAGGVPFYFDCPESNAFLPQIEDVPNRVWQKMAFVYVCSPGNPSGSVMRAYDYEKLLELAEKFNFYIIADECYSELYDDSKDPPLGLLDWCNTYGNKSFERCLVMHSLSKRSSSPGLRSGFAAGDLHLMTDYYQYRTYHGGAMPLHVQHASIAAWSDEEHVITARKFYRHNFESVCQVLKKSIEITIPDAGFYLWIKLPLDDISMCRNLFAEKNVLLLPGQYLGRAVNGYNPGENRVRIALVEPEKRCVYAAQSILNII